MRLVDNAALKCLLKTNDKRLRARLLAADALPSLRLLIAPDTPKVLISFLKVHQNLRELAIEFRGQGFVRKAWKSDPLCAFLRLVPGQRLETLEVCGWSRLYRHEVEYDDSSSDENNPPDYDVPTEQVIFDSFPRLRNLSLIRSIRHTFDVHHAFSDVYRHNTGAHAEPRQIARKLPPTLEYLAITQGIVPVVPLPTSITRLDLLGQYTYADVLPERSTRNRCVADFTADLPNLVRLTLHQPSDPRHIHIYHATEVEIHGQSGFDIIQGDSIQTLRLVFHEDRMASTSSQRHVWVGKWPDQVQEVAIYGAPAPPGSWNGRARHADTVVRNLVLAAESLAKLPASVTSLRLPRSSIEHIQSKKDGKVELRWTPPPTLRRLCTDYVSLPLLSALPLGLYSFETDGLDTYNDRTSVKIESVALPKPFPPQLTALLVRAAIIPAPVQSVSSLLPVSLMRLKMLVKGWSDKDLTILQKSLPNASCIDLVGLVQLTTPPQLTSSGTFDLIAWTEALAPSTRVKCDFVLDSPLQLPNGVTRARFAENHRCWIAAPSEHPALTAWLRNRRLMMPSLPRPESFLLRVIGNTLKSTDLSSLLELILEFNENPSCPEFPWQLFQHVSPSNLHTLKTLNVGFTDFPASLLPVSLTYLRCIVDTRPKDVELHSETFTLPPSLTYVVFPRYILMAPEGIPFFPTSLQYLRLSVNKWTEEDVLCLKKRLKKSAKGVVLDKEVSLTDSFFIEAGLTQYTRDGIADAVQKLFFPIVPTWITIRWPTAFKRAGRAFLETFAPAELSFGDHNDDSTEIILTSLLEPAMLRNPTGKDTTIRLMQHFDPENSPAVKDASQPKLADPLSGYLQDVISRHARTLKILDIRTKIYALNLVQCPKVFAGLSSLESLDVYVLALPSVDVFPPNLRYLGLYGDAGGIQASEVYEQSTERAAAKVLASGSAALLPSSLTSFFSDTFSFVASDSLHFNTTLRRLTFPNGPDWSDSTLAQLAQRLSRLAPPLNRPATRSGGRRKNGMLVSTPVDSSSEVPLSIVLDQANITGSPACSYKISPFVTLASLLSDVTSSFGPNVTCGVWNLGIEPLALPDTVTSIDFLAPTDQRSCTNSIRITRQKTISSLFVSLSTSVTTLKVSLSALPIADVRKLPSSLTHLELYIDEQLHYPELVWQLLPRRLRNLSLRTRTKIMSLVGLPESLECLIVPSLELSHDCVRFLPATLKELACSSLNGLSDATLINQTLPGLRLSLLNSPDHD